MTVLFCPAQTDDAFVNTATVRRPLGKLERLTPVNFLNSHASHSSEMQSAPNLKMDGLKQKPKVTLQPLGHTSKSDNVCVTLDN